MIAVLGQHLGRTTLILLLVLAACGCSSQTGKPGEAGISSGSSAPGDIEGQGGDSRVTIVAAPITQVAWAVRSQQILRSPDGSTWTDVTPQQLSIVAGFYAFNDDQAYVATDSEAGGVTVASTLNGGVTWRDSSTAPITGLGAGGNTVSFAFSDELHGLMTVQLEHSSSSALVATFTTDDGGTTWAQSGTATLAGPASFSDVSIAWAPGSAQGQELFSSNDGGKSWSSTGLDLGASGFTTVGTPQFSANDGVLPIVDDGRVRFFTSSDSGEHWQPAQDALPMEFSGPAFVLPFKMVAAEVWYVGIGESILMTQDGGVSWTSSRLPVPGTIVTIDGNRDDIVILVENSNCSKSEETCIDVSYVLQSFDEGKAWDLYQPSQSRG